jgi:hypothetical protein
MPQPQLIDTDPDGRQTFAHDAIGVMSITKNMNARDNLVGVPHDVETIYTATLHEADLTIDLGGDERLMSRRTLASFNISAQGLLAIACGAGGMSVPVTLTFAPSPDAKLTRRAEYEPLPLLEKMTDVARADQTEILEDMAAALATIAAAAEPGAKPLRKEELAVLKSKISRARAMLLRQGDFLADRIRKNVWQTVEDAKLEIMRFGAMHGEEHDRFVYAIATQIEQIAPRPTDAPPAAAAPPTLAAPKSVRARP